MEHALSTVKTVGPVVSMTRPPILDCRLFWQLKFIMDFKAGNATRRRRVQMFVAVKDPISSIQFVIWENVAEPIEDMGYSLFFVSS